MIKFLKNNKKLCTFIMTLAMCFAMSAICFAEGDATSVDLTSIATDTVSEIATQLLSVIGIVVTGFVGVFTLKIGVTKVFGFIKTMIGKVG